MRYILYLFTLALVFVGGMLVGNIYLPERSSSVAAAISVPDAQSAHPAIAAATLDAAQRNLHILNEALNSCPVVVGEEKERLIHQIDLFWARQDFDLKKARYELEIAKNTPGTAVTSRFAQASADYSAALKRVEKMAQDYFPQPQEEKVAEKPAKQAEAPAKQAEEKAPAKKAQQAEPAAVTQAQTPAEPQAAHADMPQGAQTQETVAQGTVAQETQTDELKTAAVNTPKDAEKPQTATVQETEQAKAETDKAPRANSTPETPAETAPQEKAAAQEQATAPKATSAATPQEKAPQRTETAAQKEPDLPAPNEHDSTAPKEQGSTAPQAQPTEPKN